MTRTIKFRARKNDYSKAWIYGGGVWTFGDRAVLFGPDEHDSPQVTVIDSETVGEFIGLSDKNRKEIWEADLVRWPDGHIDKVIWFDGGFKLQCKIDIEPCNLHAEILEVVGNIYENPELLK